MNTFHKPKFHLLQVLLCVSVALALALSAAGREAAHAAPLFDVLPSGLNGNGPGGVGTTNGSSALELWLMGNAGAFTDTGCTTAAANGTDVACWQDQSGNSQNVTQGTSTRRPNYNTAVQNGMPALTYVGGVDRDVLYRNFSPFSGNQPYTIFSAFNPSNNNLENLFAIGTPSNDRNIAYHPSWTSRRTLYHFADDLLVNGTVTGWQFAAFRFTGVTGSTNQYYYDRGNLAGSRTAAALNLPANPVLSVGGYSNRTGTGGDELTGSISEMIIFSQSLADVHRILVENYLSSKYNVALTANDVYAGDTAGNGNFDLNVAGIGQFGGNQHTASHAAGIIVVNTTFLNANGDWLLFGHNIAANSTTTADLPSSNWGSRWSRTWYMDVTDAGTTGGTVNIIFDYSDSGLGGTPTYPVGAYRLLRRAGTSGQFSDITAASGATVLIDGDQVQFLGVNVGLLDGLTFTLGVYTPPDLALVKAVAPASAAPGQAITYTLVFSNAGIGAATGVVITDTIPVSVTNTSVSSSGVVITPQVGTRYVWNVANLAPGAGGVITITGVLSTPVAAGVFTNTAVITGTGDSNPANNASSAALTVLNVAPVANDNSYSTAEDISHTVAAPGVLTNDTDPNGDPLTAVLVDTVLTGTLDLHSSGAFTYTPPLDWYGVVTFTYHAYDGALASNTATVTLTVTLVNDPPVLAAIGPQTVNELETLAFTATATDADLPAQVLTFTLDAGSVGSITPGGAYSWTPTEVDGPGVYTATIRVSDGALDDLETIAITVNEVNVAPLLAAIGPQTVNELETLAFTATAADVDLPAQVLTFTLDAGSVGSITPGGSYSWTPAEADGPGVYTATIRVSDGALDDLETIAITVNEVNVAPVIVEGDAISVTMDEDGAPTAFSLTLNAADVDGNVLTWSILIQATNGTAEASGTGTSKAIAYTPAPDYNGADSFVVQVSDGALTDTIVVNVTINPVNDPPTLADVPPQSTTEGEPLSFTIAVDDVESDTDSLTVSAASSNTALVPLSNIRISGAGAVRTITITPTDGLTGTLWITITVSDGAEMTSKGFELTVGERTSWRIYLPVVMRTFVHAPDLVVENITVAGGDVQVTIANRGSAAATDDFWVDLYVNPDPVPAGVNDIWPGRCAQGIVWGATIDLLPGETLILRLDDLYMDGALTTFHGVSAGDTVYVQVDSANVATTYGGVLETHEIAGQPYNNIQSITVSTTTAVSVSNVNGMSPDDPVELPERP